MCFAVSFLTFFNLHGKVWVREDPYSGIFFLMSYFSKYIWMARSEFVSVAAGDLFEIHSKMTESEKWAREHCLSQL